LARWGTTRELLTGLGRGDLAQRIPEGDSVNRLLAESSHEAALLGHPYLAPDHLILAVLRRVDPNAYDELCDRLAGQPIATHRSWTSILRPRGKRSAAREAGQRELQRRAQEAIRTEVEPKKPPASSARTILDE
jgi:hypothetical protein